MTPGAEWREIVVQTSDWNGALEGGFQLETNGDPRHGPGSWVGGYRPAGPGQGAARLLFNSIYWPEAANPYGHGGGCQGSCQ